MEIPLQDLLTPEEAAQRLGVKIGTLAHWRTKKRYDLPYIKWLGRIRYRPEDLKAFIERRTKEITG
ncbi:MAG: helix-turn-helix domain-containing protein [Candidatus Latescibacterota bacterium]